MSELGVFKENESHLWVPALMACAIYGGFWTALITRKRYGGVAIARASDAELLACSHTTWIVLQG